MRGVPREREAISTAPSRAVLTLSSRAERSTMCASSSRRVELQARDDAEAVAQRVGQHAGARGRADQGERRQIELDRARRRTLADHDVDLEILQRRVEDFLDHRREAVDLVDEQNVVGFQIGEQRREVAGPLQHRPRGLAQVDAHLLGDDVRQRGLAQPGRTEQQHVIERLAAVARSLDEDAELARGSSPGRCTRRVASGRSARSIASSCGAAAGAIRRSVSIIERGSSQLNPRARGGTPAPPAAPDRTVLHRLRDRRRGLIQAAADHAAHLQHRIDEIALAHRRHRELHAFRDFVDVEAHVAVFVVEQRAA